MDKGYSVIGSLMFFFQGDREMNVPLDDINIETDH